MPEGRGWAVPWRSALPSAAAKGKKLLPREMGSNLGVHTVPWVRSVWCPVLDWGSWALAGPCPHEDVPLLPRHCLTVLALPNSDCPAADTRWEGSPGRCGSG